MPLLKKEEKDVTPYSLVVTLKIKVQRPWIDHHTLMLQYIVLQYILIHIMLQYMAYVLVSSTMGMTSYAFLIQAF